MKRVRILLGASICFAFAASCGGGGGGPPPPPPPPSAGEQFPDTFTATFPEGLNVADGIEAVNSFPMWAATNEEPTDVGVIGQDAAYFLTSVSFGAPDASGNRTVTVRLAPIIGLNANAPQDQNGDNIYRYTLQGRFRGENISAEVSITIADTVARGTVIEGEAAQQLFGNPIISIPDITGDGRAELGAAIQSGIGGSLAYLVGSEFFSAMPGGRLNLANLGNTSGEFLQAAPPSAQSNFISAKAATTGVDVMVSDAVQNKLYLYPGVTSASAALRGQPNPDASPDAVVYSFPGGTPVQEGRLIGDVNGDSRNDIFVRNVAPGGGKFGIIFGRAVSSPADRQRTAAFDIEMNHATDTSTGVTTLVTELVSDLDGDAHPDMIISAPILTSQVGSIPASQGGRLWVIRSSVLRAAGPTTLNLDTLAAPQGFRLAAQVGSVVEFSDLDNDGYKTLLIGSTQRLYAIDGNDLLQVQTVDFLPGAKAMVGGLLIYDAGDIDGDGFKEVVIPFGAQQLASIFRGSSIRSLIVNPPAPGSPPIPTPRALTLGLNGVIDYATADTRFAVSLGSMGANQNGILAIGSWCSGTCPATVAGSAGQVTLIKADDIRPFLNMGAVSLEIRPQ